MTELNQAIQLRLSTAKSSVKKFSAFVENTSPDGRLRNQFVYYGAHTGRWSGRGVQPQNLTRTETDQPTLRALLAGTPADSLDKLSTCLRPCIRALRGKKLVVADLNAIEVRVLMWLAGCEEGLRVFREGKCPYKDFATDFYRIPYESVTKDQRNTCKPPVLGCGYGLGGGQKREMQNGQTVKTGLWKYAENLGVVLDRSGAHEMVSLYRSKYPEVVYYWTYLEDAFIAAYKTRKRQQVGAIFFTATPEAVKIELPSGRSIHYLNPHAWKGVEGVKISFDGLRNGGWGRQTTYGGRLCENVVQAVARDVLAEGMLRVERDHALPIVGHVHDELVVEAEKEWVGVVQDLQGAMSDDISWAPGLPLAAEGYESEFYMKG